MHRTTRKVFAPTLDINYYNFRYQMETIQTEKGVIRLADTDIDKKLFNKGTSTEKAMWRVMYCVRTRNFNRFLRKLGDLDPYNFNDVFYRLDELIWIRVRSTLHKRVNKKYLQRLVKWAVASIKQWVAMLSTNTIIPYEHAIASPNIYSDTQEYILSSTIKDALGDVLHSLSLTEKQKQLLTIVIKGSTLEEIKQEINVRSVQEVRVRLDTLGATIASKKEIKRDDNKQTILCKRQISEKLQRAFALSSNRLEYE